ncbi:MAG: flagellin [Candidatus Neomarinimicrobiota bacterium]
MRVTTNMRQGEIIRSIADSQERLLDAQTKISTTKEVAASSDGPSLYDRASRLKTLLSRNEQYQENIADGIGWASTSSDTLDSIYSLLMDVHTNGLRAMGNVNEDERPIAIQAINAMVEEMLDLANGQFMGKNLFSGTITLDTQPFSYDGSTVTYQGNDAEMQRKVGPDTYISVNTVGSEFEDVFHAAIALREAIDSEDNNVMISAMEQLEDSMGELFSSMASSGNRQKKLALTRDNLETAEINLRSHISQAEDVDLTEAILQFNAQELGFRAALESSARIMSLSILDYLR